MGAWAGPFLVAALLLTVAGALKAIDPATTAGALVIVPASADSIRAMRASSVTTAALRLVTRPATCLFVYTCTPPCVPGGVRAPRWQGASGRTTMLPPDGTLWGRAEIVLSVTPENRRTRKPRKPRWHSQLYA